MASHPYISGAGNITQMIGYLRKNFPATVTSDTVKKFGLASKNESYVVNVLQFLGLISEEGKRTDQGHSVMTIHDEVEFRKAFEDLLRKAYSDLFSIRGEDAWSLNRSDLIGYFRSADKTSDTIGDRQAGVFLALREIAGHENGQGARVPKTKVSAPKTNKSQMKKATSGLTPAVEESQPAHNTVQKPKGEVALTVRIEINLPSEGSRETYDAIFQSIKANLFP